MKNKKGFTLIELLAVIMILAFIIAITVPSIKRAIEASEDKLYDVAVKQIIKGAKQYVVEYNYKMSGLSTAGTGYVTIKELMDKGLLEENLQNPKTGDAFDDSDGIKITKLPNESYDYEYITTGLIAEVLVVAGGGSGGSSSPGNGGGGGGGAGGLIYYTAYKLNANGSYSVTVGRGGNARTVAVQTGENGANSVFDTLTAIGGGGGGCAGCNGTTGGSGGGAGYNGYSDRVGAAGTTDQGYKGGDVLGNNNGAGGGGAGGYGGNTPDTNGAPGGGGGIGGQGKTLSISGSNVTYAGGGSGGSSSPCGEAGAINTGNGGAGVYANSCAATGAGGSGIVIIRYPGSTKATGGTITSVNGYTIHTYTTVGSSTFVVSNID